MSEETCRGIQNNHQGKVWRKFQKKSKKGKVGRCDQRKPKGYVGKVKRNFQERLEATSRQSRKALPGKTRNSGET